MPISIVLLMKLLENEAIINKKQALASGIFTIFFYYCLIIQYVCVSFSLSIYIYMIQEDSQKELRRN